MRKCEDIVLINLHFALADSGYWGGVVQFALGIDVGPVFELLKTRVRGLGVVF